MFDHGSMGTLIIGLDHARGELTATERAVRGKRGAGRIVASRARLAGVLRALANRLEPVGHPTAGTVRP